MYVFQFFDYAHKITKVILQLSDSRQINYKILLKYRVGQDWLR